LIDGRSKQTAVVDPVDPEKVMHKVQQMGLTLVSVLTTHHHWDHAGGNEDLLKKMGGTLRVYGGDDRIGALTDRVKHGDELKIGDGISVTCLFTPCHTKGHMCYVARDKEQAVVFTGDTLFIGGCGRFFEGTAEQMHHALIKVLGSLDDRTAVYVGHEYTVANLRYAQHAEPDNPEIGRKMQWAEEKRARGEPTVPSTIGDEKKFNPFMRVEISETLKSRAQSRDAIAVMGFLRHEKDGFK